MMQPHSTEKSSRIIDNILMACKDIRRLSPEAYRWIHLKAGFIAHYDRDGFIEEYQTCQNLRENILANQIHNTCCNWSRNDKDYQYHLQQCEMYSQIVENLKANPLAFYQNKRTDEFCIELSKDKQNEIHKITLITHRGTSSVLCDKAFLLNLQDNIIHHLKTCEHDCI